MTLGIPELFKRCVTVNIMINNLFQELITSGEEPEIAYAVIREGVEYIKYHLKKYPEINDTGYNFKYPCLIKAPDNMLNNIVPEDYYTFSVKNRSNIFRAIANTSEDFVAKVGSYRNEFNGNIRKLKAIIEYSKRKDITSYLLSLMEEVTTELNCSPEYALITIFYWLGEL